MTLPSTTPKEPLELGLRRYVMLVDVSSGPLHAMIAQLRDLGFRVITVPSTSDAVDMLRAFPKLSLVVVNEQMDVAGSRALLAMIREHHPDLPILWHGDARGIGPSRSEALLSREPHAEEVADRVRDMLDAGDYSPRLLALLIDAATRSLGAFGAHCCARAPFVKASRGGLAELNALIAFSGTDASGHLVVSASREAARRAHARLPGGRGEPRDEELGDLLGEICNCIIGPLLQHLSRDVAASFSLPLFITGRVDGLSAAPHRASVVLELEGAAGPIFVELSAREVKAPKPELPLPCDLLTSGDFILL